MFSHVSKGILSELPHEDTLLTAVLTPVSWMTLQCSQERAQRSGGSNPGLHCRRVVRCTFTGAQSHSGTGLNWNMVCTLCMTPILHLYDLIVVKLLIFTDVDLDHLFFWRKTVLIPKPLAPIQSSYMEVKEVQGPSRDRAHGWISCCLNVILPKSLYV